MSDRADYIYLPLPHALADRLAQMPEYRRNNLHVLSQELRKYLSTQQCVTDEAHSHEPPEAPTS